MADAQSQFQSFHSTILLDVESNEKLREKRTTLLKDLKENINEDAPSYETFYQGSYELSTGVNPIAGDPDMDIGVIFDCKPDDYKDPVVLKRYVRNALERSNRTIRIRKPCVTVQYFKNGNPDLHIDLAVYCKNSTGQTQLARGRDSDPATTVYRFWEASEAKELNDKIINGFKGADRDQWRRTVRALKRWRDEKIGHKNIPSIGLTVAAWKWFKPVIDSSDAKPRDLIAIRDLTDVILSNWSGTRLTINLPVAPYSDLFENVTEVQMKEFKEKLTDLRNALNEADKQPDTHEACKILRRKFGDDFPVPEKADTTKKTESTFQSTGRSA
jgi:hypothetical protein